VGRNGCSTSPEYAVHKPFKFTVALNKAVPLMYNSLASGEMLPKVTLKWFRTSVEGKQEHFFSTVLTDATIVDIDCQMPHCQDPAKSDFTQLIQVSLAYRKIDWEHTVAGTSGADDWRAPIEA
ncbi:type VI secretion system tube protein TssD, partial [Aeromonas sp. A35_P]|uniref:type VI secretion system tube protein TssD n=1 Tax=Aeromonas sp. A35_P TaxID=1983805 RepID=UPI0011401101